MTPEQFVYWLQGFFEISDEAPGLSEKQAEVVREHLQLVFEKVTGGGSAGSSSGGGSGKPVSSLTDWKPALGSPAFISCSSGLGAGPVIDDETQRWVSKRLRSDTSFCRSTVFC